MRVSLILKRCNRGLDECELLLKTIHVRSAHRCMNGGADLFEVAATIFDGGADPFDELIGMITAHRRLAVLAVLAVQLHRCA